MKKFSLILGALALVLGLSQCTKPNMPVMDTLNLKPQSVTITTGNGTKGNFDPSATEANAIDYNWESSDVIYVYSSTAENFDPAVGGYYCGTLAYKSGAGTSVAVFENTALEVPETANSFRFMHYGKAVDVANISTDGIVVDLSDQYGRLKRNDTYPTETAISDLAVAYCDRPIDESGNYECELELQFAIIKFDLSGFNGATADKVFVSCILENGVKVSAAGKVEGVAGIFTDLENVSVTSTEYYVALRAISSGNAIKFSSNKASGTKNRFQLGKLDLTAPKKIDNNVYYTKDATGAAIKIVNKDLPSGTLPGVFTVASRSSVHFSKGNLYYDPNKATIWRIETNQWDCASSYDADHVSLFYWSRAASTVGDNGYGRGENYVHDSEATTVNWGNLIDTDVDFSWTVLSKDQMMNLIGQSSGSFPRTIKTTKSNNYKRLVVSSTKAFTPYGYLIVPDNFKGKLSDITETDQLRPNGILFIPAAGHRKGSVYQSDGKGYQSYGNEARYWTRTKGDNSGTYGQAYNLRATNPDSESAVCYVGDSDRNRAYAVRLVTQ